MLVKRFCPSTSTELHAATPPGSFEVNTSPPPTATQSDTEGHDTALPPTPAVTLQAALLPAGSVELYTLPPTATHSDVDGQATPDNTAVRPSGKARSTNRGEDQLRGDAADAEPAATPKITRTSTRTAARRGRWRTPAFAALTHPILTATTSSPRPHPYNDRQPVK